MIYQFIYLIFFIYIYIDKEIKNHIKYIRLFIPFIMIWLIHTIYNNFDNNNNNNNKFIYIYNNHNNDKKKITTIL